jgi:hypothetical protein
VLVGLAVVTHSKLRPTQNDNKIYLPKKNMRHKNGPENKNGKIRDTNLFG